MKDFLNLLKRFIADKPCEEPRVLPTEKMTLGALGEDAVLEYLTSEGYLLLERNWRHSHSEIDLIMKDGRCVVFCEVRCQDVDRLNYRTPAESVDRKKQESLMHAASFYMGGYSETFSKAFKTTPPCRFDVAEVFVKNNEVIKINHIKDAFIKVKTYKKGTGYKSCRH